MTHRVERADVLAWASEYDGPKFHALLCDAPYELGFMGKTWDDSGVSFQPETWAALAKHLHPGAFGMTFAGSRTWHRIAVAIEDAGLVIHPSIFAWANGQGFPKATRIDTQVDKAAIVACPDCHATGKTRHPEAQEWQDYWLDEPCQLCGGTGKVKGAEREVVGTQLLQGTAAIDGHKGFAPCAAYGGSGVGANPHHRPRHPARRRMAGPPLRPAGAQARGRAYHRLPEALRRQARRVHHEHGGRCAVGGWGADWDRAC